MDESIPPTSTPARRWQTRVARAAAAAVGRSEDSDSERSAALLLDRGRNGAAIALATLVMFGGLTGWAAAREVVRPVDAPINVAVAILVLVGGPWILVGLRTLALLLLGRRVGPWLGRSMPYGFVRFTERHAKDRRLGMATARQLGSLLAAGAGRHLASLGGAAFWCGYAGVAVLAIWLSTARVAYGFGWESSWVSPEIGRDVVRVVAAPLSFAVDVDALAPVTVESTTTASLEGRRRWIVLLSAAIGMYLLVPMTLWAMWHAARGHLAATRWRPARTTGIRTARPTGPNPTESPTPTAPRPQNACTHLVRIEHPDESSSFPPSLASLHDLGQLDSRDDLNRVVVSRPTRAVILAWLPATPDRGVARRIDAVVAASEVPPVVVLDGGDALREREPDRTVVARIADWRKLALASGCDVVECDLEAATDASRTILDTMVTGGGATEVTLDPTVLDASFGLIGQGLEASPPLPDPEAIAGVAGAIADMHGRTPDSNADWIVRLRTRVVETLGEVNVDPEAIRTIGTGLLPSALRNSAVWVGVGGILGIGACAAVATIAPAALAALPGWAGSGAGLGGVLGLARGLRRTGSPDHPPDAASEDRESELGEAVLGLASWSVLWWSQGGDEARTTRLLDALHAEHEPPRLADADAARRWLAAARPRLVEALS